MAKAVSPIRLQENIMQAAILAGKSNHRSATEQIEYWAEMGRKVTMFLNPDDLLSVASGLANIKLVPVLAESVSAESVFQSLENDRSRGSLSNLVTKSTLKYQASLSHPGFLEQIGSNGDCVVGKFEQGEFVTLFEGAS